MTETRSENATEQRPDGVKGHSSGFMRGLVGGALLGTVAGVLLAPQMDATLRNLRRRLTGVAANAGDATAQRYRDATTQVGDAVDDLQQKGRDLYGKALSAVVRGAEEFQERATEAQTDLEEREANTTGRSL